jgi:hypothetical protein
MRGMKRGLRNNEGRKRVNTERDTQESIVER